MTIKYLAATLLTGLSGDTKPTNLPDNSMFIETNTGDIYKIASGTWSILNNATGGAGGAPSDAQYITLATSAGLSAERTLAAGSGISLTDGGANNNATVAVDTAVTATLTGAQNLSNKTIIDALTFDEIASPSNPAANKLKLYMDNSDEHLKIKNSGGTVVDLHTGSGAPTSAQYVTLATDGTLSAERTLAVDNTLKLTDGGAGSTITVGEGDEMMTTPSKHRMAWTNVNQNTTTPFTLNGWFEGLSFGGTGTRYFDGVTGMPSGNFATGTTSNTRAGLGSSATKLGCVAASALPIFVGKCALDNAATSNVRFYHGFSDATTIPTSNTVLASGDHGIFVGFNSSDSVWQIFHNNAGGSMIKVAYTGNISIDLSVFHTFKIKWNSTTSVDVQIDNNTVHTITTRLPSSTAELIPYSCCQNTSTTSRSYYLAWLWGKCDP